MSSAVDSNGPINYATGALYSPAGALSSVSNNTSIVSTYFYNNRLQPCRISVKNTGTAPASCTDAATGNVLDFAYNFSVGTANNGNVTAITNNRDTTRSQSFLYDSLNRISSALTSSTHATSPANCWGETYSIDPWGNLQTIAATTNPNYTGCTEESGFDFTNFIGTNNHITYTSYGYDAPGNLSSGSGVSGISYNAENQLITAAGVTYTYDGDGNRVQKSNGKLYWYGMGSDPLDETDLTGSVTNTGFNEYIFFGGKRIARRDYLNNVNYYFSDHLGTARLSTNSSGSICYDADFYPFGGERILTDTCDSAYKFTGKERDSESTLDNFGARYFSSSMGRFTSPDPDNAGAINEDPQSWNGYAYARNNPLRYTDPDGLDYKVCVDNGNGGQNCTTYANLNDFQKAANASGATLNGNDQNGQILVNGKSIGNYQFFVGPGVEGPGVPEDNILAPILFGGIFGGLKAGIRGIAEGLFGGGAKAAAETTVGTAAEQVIAAGTKNAVKQAIEDAAISDGQKAAVKSALDRAASTAAVKVEKLADGSLRIATQRAGRNGFQVIEKVVDAGGKTTSVVQKGFDAPGNLVHVDQKFP